MDINEYELLKEQIVKEYGLPMFEQYEPTNEAAKKLFDLKIRFNNEARQIEATKKTIKDIKHIVNTERIDFHVPDDIIKESWLTPFNEDQKTVIRCWLDNIDQDKREIAEATAVHISAVRATFRSDAFKALRKHLELSFKQLLPLEAIIKLRTLIKSKTENVALQAAKLVLLDAGLYKGDSLDVTTTKTTDVVLDDATQDRLRKLAKEYRETKSNDKA